ncbi:DUF2846 domain-containing protein [Hymenobacter monticola]|uniref:DUF2846 domain-containing protein n=1 Tax=Hymenobacter monticola TaxID=1705399 RepID=A0ABY4BC57_9BACT|nr:DUF2846 domain-containing protein [Hymenobacter monticola]UOE35591.1 DUF2846 domain-containing protein [Hymenobacter monticola]
MKTFLLTLLMAGASLAARAQTFYPDLDLQTLDVPGRVVHVEQVLDGRAGTPPIGIAYRAGRAAAIEFRQGVGPALTAFALRQLPARPTDHPVVLCLRSLHLGETLGGPREQATADLTADVYEHLPDGYHFVQAVAAHASTQGREVTYWHAVHLAQMLAQCLGQLNTADWAAGAARPARLLTALPTDAPAAGRRAAILRETPRRGLYFRFEEFLQNRPDTTLTFALDTARARRYPSPIATAQWLGVARVRPKVRFGANPDATLGEDLWGFCDGQQVFVKYNKLFYPLTRQGSFFTFVAEAPLDQLHAEALAQSQSRAAMLAGLVGAAVARTNMPDHTAEPMTYGLDMTTGALGPFPALGTPVRTDTAYVYLYRPAQAADAPPVGVFVDGREMGALRPGQYLEVPWTRFGKPMRLCLNGVPVSNPCQLLVPNAAQLSYLKIDASRNGPAWQWMSPRQGSAELDELDKLRK